MNIHLLAPSAVLLLGAPLLSQIACSPAVNKNVEGSSYIYNAFGQSNSSGWRFQQVHDDLQGKQLTVRELGFRRDANYMNRFSAYDFTVQLILSTAATQSSTMSTTFDQNHGTNRSVVVTNKVINMPATVGDGVAQPFAYRMKFDTAYTFNGGSGGLCWEARISLQRNLITTTYFDAAYSQDANPPLAQAYFGQGCAHTSQTTVAQLQASSSCNYTSNTGLLYLNGYYLDRSGVALASIGFSRTAYGALPLPFVLPGTATAYSGPCSIYGSLDLIFATTSDANGYGTLTIPIPVDINYAGAKLFSQYLTEDKAASVPIKLVTSNAVELQYVPPFTRTPISCSVAGSPLSATGTVTQYYGYVTALY